jgi:tetratricopeptide (TPR) repeat protein
MVEGTAVELEDGAPAFAGEQRPFGHQAQLPPVRAERASSRSQLLLASRRHPRSDRGVGAAPTSSHWRHRAGIADPSLWPASDLQTMQRIGWIPFDGTCTHDLRWSPHGDHALNVASRSDLVTLVEVRAYVPSVLAGSAETALPHRQARVMCMLLCAEVGTYRAGCWRLIVYVHRRMGDLDRALEAASQGLRAVGADPALLFSCARTRLEKGNFSQAMDDLAQLLDVEAELGTTWHQSAAQLLQAVCLTRLGRYADALALCAQLPSDAAFWALGELQTKDGVERAARANLGT